MGLIINEQHAFFHCFYYLQGGELYLVGEGQVVDTQLLLYRELSPLQQLQGQRLYEMHYQQHKGCG